MFKALEFTYDGKSSSDYSLKLVSIGGGAGVTSDNIGFPLEIEEDKIKRNPVPFFYGVEVMPKLTFKIQMAYIPDVERQDIDSKIISRGVIGSINKWLFKREYKDFKIIDTDYDIIYRCMFQNPKQVEIANYPIGIEVDVICDRPYGIKRQTITKTVSGTTQLKITNIGFDNDYIKPEIQFTMASAGGITITNTTDNSNSFVFTGLNAGETIYVSNSREEIISSTGLNRNPNFNFKWFRLTPNYVNNISISGNATVTFRIEFAIGG